MKNSGKESVPTVAVFTPNKEEEILKLNLDDGKQTGAFSSAEKLRQNVHQRAACIESCERNKRRLAAAPACDFTQRAGF